VSVSAHLRDRHSYSLAESVRWSPSQMATVHETEHAETTCDHEHSDKGGIDD
jgi:hypothetical protein